MYSKSRSAALWGIKGECIFVETDISNGLPNLTIVGLPDVSVKESKDRVRSAIVNTGFRFPSGRITVNLVPAGERKVGSHFDLPIAISILTACEFLAQEAVDRYAFLGELSLDGTVNGVEGVLPMIIAIAESGIKKIFVPERNLQEASVVRDLELYPVNSLKEVAGTITGLMPVRSVHSNQGILSEEEAAGVPDYSDVIGQEQAKRALTVAAAAMHNILIAGPPGVGKSMLAKRLPGIMPPMTYEERLELTKIYSIAGALKSGEGLINRRPFRAPHHTISDVALAGGGSIPKPGEITLAHYGVLFLDEFPEFSRRAIEVLRQPMENEEIEISRSKGKVKFPAKFLLICAMNLCPCANTGSEFGRCTCSATQIRNYYSKLSGPVMDRIDICIQADRTGFSLFNNSNEQALPGTSTKEMREAVILARNMQLERYRGQSILYNSQLTPDMFDKYCTLDTEGENLLNDAYRKLGLSLRSCHNIIRLARTLADMDEKGEISANNVAEALQYKNSIIEKEGLIR